MAKQIKAKKKLAHKRTLGSVISFERRKSLEGWGFSLPWVIGFIIFIMVPLVLSIRISFYITQLTDLYGFEGQSKWNGIQNYVDIVQDPEVGEVMLNSFLDSLWQVPIIVFFALFVAVLLKQKFAGRVYFRVIFFIPVILAGVIMSYLFGEGVGSISVFGSLVNSSSGIFSSFGGKITQYIGDIMWSSSVEILIFLAALQSVPDILYEVVEIDGATAWESFWHVTLPYISPFVILNCIYALVDSFTKYNNPVMSMMNEMTEKGTEYGMASALSWMYMLLALVTILIFILFTRRWLK
ncbi:MAG: sugar ABC transporter permease [Clostridia bacterium]|nr:sugar ABC transporter permease [Clostridia bacterium]